MHLLARVAPGRHPWISTWNLVLVQEVLYFKARYVPLIALGLFFSSPASFKKNDIKTLVSWVTISIQNCLVVIFGRHPPVSTKSSYKSSFAHNSKTERVIDMDNKEASDKEAHPPMKGLPVNNDDGNAATKEDKGEDNKEDEEEEEEEEEDEEVQELTFTECLENLAKDMAALKKQLDDIDKCNLTLHDDRVTVHKKIDHLKDWVGILDRNLAPCGQSLGFQPNTNFGFPTTYEPCHPVENPDQPPFHGRTSDKDVGRSSMGAKSPPRKYKTQLEEYKRIGDVLEKNKKPFAQAPAASEVTLDDGKKRSSPRSKAAAAAESRTKKARLEEGDKDPLNKENDK